MWPGWWPVGCRVPGSAPSRSERVAPAQISCPGRDGEPACRRGSVHRPLAGIRLCDHPSVRPTWECQRAGRPLPVWPCSGWGLPSRPGCPDRWCALTAPFHPHLCPAPYGAEPSAVCFLWHFPAGRPDWPLASILPCGAPTFLSVADHTAVTRPAHRHLQCGSSACRWLPDSNWFALVGAAG